MVKSQMLEMDFSTNREITNISLFNYYKYHGNVSRVVSRNG